MRCRSSRDNLLFLALRNDKHERRAYRENSAIHHKKKFALLYRRDNSVPDTF